MVPRRPNSLIDYATFGIARSLWRALRSYGIISEMSMNTTSELLKLQWLDFFHIWGVFRPMREGGREGWKGAIPPPRFFIGFC